MLIYYISASLLNEVVLCKMEACLKARESPLKVTFLCFVRMINCVFVAGNPKEGMPRLATFKLHTEFSSIELCL